LTQLGGGLITTLEKIKKEIEILRKEIRLTPKKDDYLILHIDQILQRNGWDQLSKRYPETVEGVTIGPYHKEYRFTYRTPTGTVRVEMWHEIPNVKMRINSRHGQSIEKFRVTMYVELKAGEVVFKNETNLRRVLAEIMKRYVRHRMHDFADS